MNPLAGVLFLVVVWLFPIAQVRAQDRPTRLNVWDIHIGELASAIQNGFINYACGTNGGPPSIPLKNFTEFKKCRPDANGLYEVYFEYDDELEYIARAHDNDHEINIWAGTHEVNFPVMVSALFDDAGILRGIRLVTDARPEHRNDITDANRKKRDEAYTLATVMASRFDIDPERDCEAIPPAEGETPVGSLFVKRVCERTDGSHSSVRIRRKEITYFLQPLEGRARITRWERAE